MKLNTGNYLVRPGITGRLEITGMPVITDRSLAEMMHEHRICSIVKIQGIQKSR